MLYGTSPEARSKWQKPEEGDRPFPVSSLTGPCLPAPARAIPAPAAPALPERGRLTVCQLEAIREPLLRRDRQQLRARVLPGPPSARRLLKAAARPYTFCQCGGPARMPPPRPALPSAPPPADNRGSRLFPTRPARSRPRLGSRSSSAGCLFPRRGRGWLASLGAFCRRPLTKSSPEARRVSGRVPPGRGGSARPQAEVKVAAPLPAFAALPGRRSGGGQPPGSAAAPPPDRRRERAPEATSGPGVPGGGGARRERRGWAAAVTSVTVLGPRRGGGGEGALPRVRGVSLVNTPCSPSGDKGGRRAPCNGDSRRCPLASFTGGRRLVFPRGGLGRS